MLAGTFCKYDTLRCSPQGPVACARLRPWVRCDRFRQERVRLVRPRSLPDGGGASQRSARRAEGPAQRQGDDNVYRYPLYLVYEVYMQHDGMGGCLCRFPRGPLCCLREPDPNTESPTCISSAQDERGGGAILMSVRKQDMFSAVQFLSTTGNEVRSGVWFAAPLPFKRQSLDHLMRIPPNQTAAFLYSYGPLICFQRTCPSTFGRRVSHGERVLCHPFMWVYFHLDLTRCCGQHRLSRVTFVSSSF